DTISSTNVLTNFNDYVSGNKYDVIMLECCNNILDNKEMLRQAFNAMAYDGRAFVLVPAAFLFNMKHNSDREYIIDNFHIEGVITLKNTVFDFTSLSLALIILDKNKGDTWFTSASSIEEVIKLVTSGRNVNHNHNIYYSTAVDPSNLMPDFYNGQAQKIDSILDEYETKTLSEVAELFIGRSVPREELGGEDGDFSYIRVGNIIDGQIVSSEYVKNEFVDKYARQILFPGDILVSKYFGEKRIVKIQESDCPAIASDAFIVIRALRVPEDYLYNYFCSRVGKNIFQKQLGRIESGTVIPHINLKDIKKLRIPIFDNVTMFEMMNIDILDSEVLVELVEYLDMKVIGSRAEKIAIEMLRSNGWSENEIVSENRNFAINLSQGEKYIPDIVLKNDKEVLAILEVKVSTRMTSSTWLERMTKLQHCKDVPLFIFTNLNKFDLYLTRTNKKVTVHTVPSKIHLLELIESGGSK
ncbi:restriction endonuclease subunit S, partial [Bacillus mobilis]|uniref:restriction endonuclease subunit S n=1 Tax=Bacillus mobilis TaxID=2026190 RepID=UPI0035E03D85